MDILHVHNYFYFCMTHIYEIIPIILMGYCECAVPLMFITNIEIYFSKEEVD